MDRAVLTEYADMREEIKDLRRRIEAGQRELNRINRLAAADSVTWGKKGGRPLRVVKIQGAPETRIGRKQKALEKKVALLEELEAALVEKQAEVEECIQQIEKSELRTMFRLHYIDDFPWYKVAIKMNGIFPKRRIKYTEDSCRMRHNRYFEGGDVN